MSDNIFNDTPDAGDIFNLNAETFVNPPKKTKGFELYQPSADEGREGVYKAVIRFLPWHKKPSESKVHKYYVWVVDPVQGDSFSVDCPSTVGQKSILKDTYWKLKNSTSASDQELAKNFSRAENYYSLVQIIQDPNKPELEGKIMVYKFGAKINAKIEAQLKPQQLGVTPCNPYDLFEGKNFALLICKKAQWNNYDDCAFLSEPGRIPITLPGETKPIQRTKEDMDRVLAWLQKESPDLDKFRYKEWTDETREKVTRAIKNSITDAKLVSQLLAGQGGSAASAPAATAQSVEFSTPAPKAPQTSHTKSAVDEVASVQTSHEKEAPAKPKAAAGSAVDMDDLYEGL